MKTESEMKINQYQSYKDFAEDTETRGLLSLLFSLPSNAFLAFSGMYASNRFMNGFVYRLNSPFSCKNGLLIWERFQNLV